MNFFDIEIAYKNNKNLKKDDVEKIMEWIKQQPHLPEINEHEVLMFYFAYNYSVEQVKQKLDYYFTFRTHTPELFANLDTFNNELKQTLDVCSYVTIRNKLTSKGYRVTITGLIDTDPSKLFFTNAVKLLLMSFYASVYEDQMPAGDIIILDLKGVTMGHVARVNPLIVKKGLTLLQECIPLRIKEIHFINSASIVDKVLNIIKPFMKQELADVLHLHPNCDSLYEFVSKDLLPKEYGGTNGCLKTLQNENKLTLISKRQQFLFEETRKVNEKLRPGKPKTASDLFGFEGNFKKLDFD